MSDRLPFWWSDEAVQILKERYVLDGPTATAARLGTSLASVQAKAKRLGIRPKSTAAPAHVWTEAEVQMMRDLYPTADRQTLEKAFGLPYYILQHQARRMKIYNTTGQQRATNTRTQNNKSVDIRFFDQWTEQSAYVLGFLFADGSIGRTNLSHVIIALSIRDMCVLNYLKQVTRSTRDFINHPEWTDDEGYVHKPSCRLILSSVVLVKRLMSLGLMPSKTYRDDPFPNVPDEFLPHFIRGYFDGDGTAYISGEGTPGIRFIGTPKFVTGLRDALVRLTGMREARVFETQGKRALWARAGWNAYADIVKFRDFIYPKGFEFCLRRKKSKIDDGIRILEMPRATTYFRYTKEEKDLIRSKYLEIGPAKLAEQLGRHRKDVRDKARAMGIEVNLYTEDIRK